MMAYIARLVVDKYTQLLAVLCGIHLLTRQIGTAPAIVHCFHQGATKETAQFLTSCPSPGCCQSCSQVPPSCTRGWQPIGSSGPKCPTSSPSEVCLATIAWTSWTRSTSCCRRRARLAATTSVSTAAWMTATVGVASNCRHR